MESRILLNKRILITGASSGIGRACAVEASALGANCILLARNKEELIHTSNLCLTLSEIVCIDLTDDESVRSFSEQIDSIDGIVHCAGAIQPRPIKFLKREHLTGLFDLNYNAPVLLTSSLLRNGKINNNASIVFISSISSQHPYFGGAVYVSSKAAIEAFSKTLAIEVASKMIRSNVLLPGLVMTQMLEQTRQAAGEDNFENYEKQYPLGFGTPEDVANAVCFLLSEKSKWITGSEIKLDGGLVLNSKKA